MGQNVINSCMFKSNFKSVFEKCPYKEVTGDTYSV